MKQIKANLILLAILVGIIMGIVISANLNLNAPSNAEDANTRLKEKQEAAIAPKEALAIAKAFSNATAWVAEMASPAVVSITVLRKQRGAPHFDIFRGWYYPEQTIQGMGSGFLVSEDGYLVTNYHVVANADRIIVKLLDDRELEGKVMGEAPRLDLAVVKIEGTSFPTLKLGDSDRIRVGETVLAIGAPFNLRHTVTQGIISATDRINMQLTQVEDFIQTDAAINPGNSGGPLLNLNGEVIGINTAINTRSGSYEGISFAIPSNVANFAFERLKHGEKIEGSYIGVITTEITPDIAAKTGLMSPSGCYIRKVLKDGPAGKAGLKQGDIVISVNGKRVRGPLSFFNMIYFKAPGTILKLRIWRDSEEIDAEVIVAKRTEDIEKKYRDNGDAESRDDTASVGGATVKANPDRKQGGVIILRIAKNSNAESAGIRQGDVILAIGRTKMVTPQDFGKAFSKAIEANSVVFRIIRSGAILQLQNRGFVVNDGKNEKDIW